jgi:phytoene dehydrogenase-like protein
MIDQPAIDREGEEMSPTRSGADSDVVVIGSGHNGLTCAAYLAKAGLGVTVVEGEESIGGGTATRELTLPGFRHNTCGNYFHGFENYPIMRDLELDRYGFGYIIPEVQQAYVFADDRALVIHRDLESSRASISRFSPADAGTWTGLSRRFAQALPLLVATEFTPPPQASDLTAEAVAKGIIDQALADELAALRQMTPYDAVDAYFESEQMRVLLKKLIHVVQATNKPGVGALLPAFFLNLTRNGMARGGTQSLPDALAAIVQEHGGEILTGKAVTRVLVDGGRAVGVRLDDGSEIRAGRAVVSGVDFTQLVEMTGFDHFAPGVQGKAKNWDWTSGGSLATVHLALRQAPHYRAVEFDPDVARAYNISFGADDSAQLVESMADVTGERFPALPVGNGSCNTMHDPSYVNGEGHVAFWWPFAPYVVDGDPMNWDRRRDEYQERMLEVWKSVTTNLDGDNILGVHLRTPLDVSRGNAAMRNGAVRMGPYTQEQSRVNRPHPDLADYRIPGLAGLYHSSSTSPNGGGLSGAAGYCAAGAIVYDLGVDRWWPEMTLEYADELAVR